MICKIVSISASHVLIMIDIVDDQDDEDGVDDEEEDYKKDDDVKDNHV